MFRNMIFLFLIELIFLLPVAGQENLESLLDEKAAADSIYTMEALFKGTRIINGHSVKTTAPGGFVFIVTHRFGEVKSGWYDFFGLDQANTRIGLDFGVLDWLSVGVGRSSYEKTFDGFVKTSLLQQKTSNRPPVTLVYLAEVSQNTIKNIFPPGKDDFWGRLTTSHQLLVARKITPSFTFQVAPALSYSVYNPVSAQQTTIFANGFAARLKLTNRITLNGEYYLILEENLNTALTDPLAIGVNIETGGHIFQLHFTNTQAPFLKGFLGGPNGNWFKGEFYFGFNITRVFSL